jgi:hypothetical protein
VKTHSGPVWLSVPVLHGRGKHQRIEDVHIDNSQPFRDRHLKLLRMSYGSTPFFDDVFPLLQEIYGRDQARLVDLNTQLIEAICSYLNADVRIVRRAALLSGIGRAVAFARRGEHPGKIPRPGARMEIRQDGEWVLVQYTAFKWSRRGGLKQLAGSAPTPRMTPPCAVSWWHAKPIAVRAFHLVCTTSFTLHSGLSLVLIQTRQEIWFVGTNVFSWSR